MALKIGILGLFYNCADLLPEVLAPWLALKEAGQPVVLAGINVQFTENAHLRFKDTDDATRRVLDGYRSRFDFLEFGKQPLKDEQARNVVLNYLLSQDVDAVWIVDGDELYTPEQIRGLIEYVEKTPQFDYYHIPLDNILFDRVHFGVPFVPPRIFRTGRRGGISHFTFENELQFKDGTHIYSTVPGIVPKRVAYIRHITWPKSSAVDKICYQRQRFGFCPYTFDEKTGEIGVDPAYYALHKTPMPKMEGDRLVWPPRPRLEVALSLDDRAEEANRDALVKVMSALLAMERRNEIDIHLTVFNPYPGYQESIRNFVGIMPFDATLTNIAGQIPSGESVCALKPQELAEEDIGSLIALFSKKENRSS